MDRVEIEGRKGVYIPRTPGYVGLQCKYEIVLCWWSFHGVLGSERAMAHPIQWISTTRDSN